MLNTGEAAASCGERQAEAVTAQKAEEDVNVEQQQKLPLFAGQ